MLIGPCNLSITMKRRPRRTEIENDQIRHVLAGLAYRGDRIRGEARVIAVCLEEDVVPKPHIGVVLNDENLFVGHGTTPPW
jgi:hypothetical protein